MDFLDPLRNRDIQPMVRTKAMSHRAMIHINLSRYEVPDISILNWYSFLIFKNPLSSHPYHILKDHADGVKKLNKKPRIRFYLHFPPYPQGPD